MIVFDIESDGLLEEATKAHIFSWTEDGVNYHDTTNPNEFLDELSEHSHAGAHNSFRFDFPLLKKLYNYDYKGIQIDTLWLSWYLFPRMTKHGLDYWGELLGYPKVKVENDQWQEGNYDLMKSRVVRDVEINWKLWVKQRNILKELYG